MNKSPKISVIVPVYNVALFIERCLRSIMQQTLSEGVECILVNDCTPDNSIEIAKKLINEYKGPIQFRIISHEKNRGLAAARNTGVEAAQGIYIQHIDSDDYVEPTMLEELYNEAIKTNADIVGCDFYLDYGDHRIVRTYDFQPYPSHKIEDIIRHKYAPYLCRKLIKKELYEEYQLKAPEGINMGEDFLMSVQLHYYAQSESYVKKPLYNYVQYNSGSITAHTFSLKRQQQHIQALLSVEKFLKEKDIYNKYKVPFSEVCFNAKKLYITAPQLRDCELWENLFPESHQYIWKYNQSFLWKIGWQLIILLPKRIIALFYPILDKIKGYNKRQ